MKKIIFAMFLALAAPIFMTSCSEDDEDLVLSDLSGYTFSGTEGSDTYAITFDASAQNFTFNSTISGETLSYGGTYSISGKNVILDYGLGVTETLESDGPKTLNYYGIALERE